MQKALLLLLLAVWLTPSVSAQTPTSQAKWTDDQKVILEALPAHVSKIILPLTPALQSESTTLTNLCEKLSQNQLTQWTLSDDQKAFVVSLNREAYPDWSAREWEVVVNRLVRTYLTR